MRLLLDTSSFLWFVAGSDRLSGKAKELMEDFDNELVLSVASLWEMAIKVSIGKLELLGQFDQFIPAVGKSACLEKSRVSRPFQIFCPVHRVSSQKIQPHAIPDSRGIS